MTVGTVDITIDGGTVGGNLFGGAHARQNGYASVTNVAISVTGDGHSHIYAGGWAQGNSTSHVETAVITVSGENTVVDYIYGGGANGSEGENDTSSATVGNTTITVTDEAQVNVIFMGGRYSSAAEKVTLIYNSSKKMDRLSGISSSGLDNTESVVELQSSLEVDGIDFVDKFIINEGCKLEADIFYLGNRNADGTANGATVFDFHTDGFDGAWDAIAGISDFTNAQFAINGKGQTAWTDTEAALVINGYELSYNDTEKTVTLKQLA
jgi:hypothetical protein